MRHNIFARAGIVIAMIATTASLVRTSNAQCQKGPASYKFEWHTDRPGGDYRTFTQPSPCPASGPCFDTREPDCKSACLRDGRCLAYTWVMPASNRGDAACWLKDTLTPAISNSMTNTGVMFEYDTDRAGSDYAVYWATYPGDCEDICTGDANCYAWTWQRSNHYCWLKNSVPGASHNTDTISGYQEYICVY
jgi:hypothetical protein